MPSAPPLCIPQCTLLSHSVISITPICKLVAVYRLTVTIMTNAENFTVPLYSHPYLQTVC